MTVFAPFSRFYHPQQLAGFAAARNATYAAPVALLSVPVTAACADLSFTVPVSGPFDRIVTTEDMGAGQVRVASLRKDSTSGSRMAVSLLSDSEGQ